MRILRFGGCVGKREARIKMKQTIGGHWVILAFVFLTPLGIPLIGLRFLRTREDYWKNGRFLLKLSAVSLGLFLLLLIFGTTDVQDALISLYFFGAGGAVGLLMSQIMIRQSAREEKYKSAVVKHRLTKLWDIAAAVKLPAEVVTKDLQRLIEGGIFPGAELDVGAGLFLLNKGRPVDAPLVTLRCESCGATVVTAQGQSGVCAYCGTPTN